MDVGIRKPLEKVLSRLALERQRIEGQIAAVEKALSLHNGDAPVAPATDKKPPRRSRTGMSTTARRAVSRRMKAYWAKRKAGTGRRKARVA
jgi:hypothetical protein